LVGKGYGYLGPFGLGDGAFDGYMIDLSIVVSPLLLSVEINVGTSSDCNDYAMGGKGVSLLWKFTDL
jgi:hypothetical protein